MIPLTTSASCSTMSDAGDVGKIVDRKDDGMAKKTKKPNQNMQAWIEARKRHHLSHAQVHMARELGMNPAKLGKIDNHKQQPWKLPLPQFIEELYVKRFGKTSPEAVLSIETRSSEEGGKAHCPVACRGQPDNAGKLHYVDGVRREQVTGKPHRRHWGRWPAACYIRRFPTAIVSGA